MLYEVSYYYLATGMDGIADTKDFGVIEASSEFEAKEVVVNKYDTKRLRYGLDNVSHRHWGLTAKLTPRSTK